MTNTYTFLVDVTAETQVDASRVMDTATEPFAAAFAMTWRDTDLFDCPVVRDTDENDDPFVFADQPNDFAGAIIAALLAEGFGVSIDSTGGGCEQITVDPFVGREVEAEAAAVAAGEGQHFTYGITNGDSQVPGTEYPDAGETDADLSVIRYTADGSQDYIVHESFDGDVDHMVAMIKADLDELTFDECEALGLDGTGCDLAERFPYTVAKLTPLERAKLAGVRK
jgi:hypothetical protein